MRHAHRSLNDTCKAVVIQGVGRASLDEIEVPAVEPGYVAIHVAYVGVCTTDLEIIKGTLGYYKNQLAKYPIVPGHEVSGHVAATGPGVTNLSVGAAVVVECIQGCGACHACLRAFPVGCPKRAELGVIGRNGGYSEFIVVPARFVHRTPTSLDMRKACLCEPLAVAIKGLARLARAWGDSPEPRRCAVIGAGPLGRLCSMVLAYRGHAVTLFDQDPRRLSSVSGAISTSQALEHLEEFDALVEATGHQVALEATLGASRAGATILLLGLPYAPSAFSFERIVAYDKTVIGSVGSGPDEFAESLKLLAALDTSAFTETVLPLEAYEHGWELARSRSRLKVLLSPRSASRP